MKKEPASAAAMDSAADAGAPSQLTPVTLLLNWFPEVEHGGYYTALIDNLYRDAGLDVTIQPGGPNSPVAQQVARGAVMFGVSNADNVLLSRAQEAFVVAVMAPLQTSPRCIMTHASAGIHGFDDLKNLTLAMSNSLAFSFYLRKKVPLENVRIVPYAGSVAPFLNDPRFAQQGYVFSEPFVARQQGGDPQVLMLSDLGFNPYTSVLVTSDTIVREQPDLVRKMAMAAVEGWRRYLASPAATNRRLHELNPQMPLDVLEFGAEAIKPLADGTAGVPLGQMTLARWQELAEQLVYCEQLKATNADVDRAFTNDFLPR